MREIKFRALYKGNLYQVNFLDLKAGSVDINVNGVATTTSIKNTTIQQYTGLKDKNGKEIYEGDILGGLYAGGYIGWCERCKQFQYFGCKDECFACGGDVHWSELSVEKELEVIGNIHENPELLN